MDTKTTITYVVRDIGGNGGYYSQDRLSSYYDNDRRYNLDDARKHKAELLARGIEHTEIVLISTVEIVIE